MRTIVVFIFFFFLGCSSGIDKRSSGENDNSEKESAKAKIFFLEEVHDFGRVTEGEKVGWYFKYRNDGDADLIIKKASASCGCTVPEFDRKPLPPGEESSLKVIYDSRGRSGFEEKTVTIESNAENNLVRLKMKVEVINK
jgi:hypothetical protein